MSQICPECGSLKTSGQCETCGWDPLDEDASDRLAFDGGREAWSYADHLEAALEKADDEAVRFFIRSALQQAALQRGEVGWMGTVATEFAEENGGDLD